MEDFRSTLKAHGLKATSQRLAVHSVMLELGHASADQVCERIEEAGSAKVTVSSVYNILSQLASLGIYKHRLSANNKMYFDVNTYNHIHLYDTENHEFRDIPDKDLIEEIVGKIRRRRFKGYRVDDVEIHILCHPTKRRSKKTAV